MTDMDHALRGVTVEMFIETLRDATANLGVVRPAQLRAPLALWLRAAEERAVRERWTHLLARPVVAEWNAAQAILAEVES
jgi:hypothetical protein